VAADSSNPPYIWSCNPLCKASIKGQTCILLFYGLILPVRYLISVFMEFSAAFLYVLLLLVTKSVSERMVVTGDEERI
jgi:hypothetical protein